MIAYLFKLNEFKLLDDYSNCVNCSFKFFCLFVENLIMEVYQRLMCLRCWRKQNLYIDCEVVHDSIYLYAIIKHLRFCSSFLLCFLTGWRYMHILSVSLHTPLRSFEYNIHIIISHHINSINYLILLLKKFGDFLYFSNNTTIALELSSLFFYWNN